MGGITLKLDSPAKLTMLLDLVRKRPDNYHETRYLMQELELRDELWFEPSGEIEMQCKDTSIFTDERNLAVKTARALKEKFGVAEGAKIFLEKRIPMTGGLGGGSSNAAATTIALNKMWGLGMTQENMIRFMAPISTDACFSIIGGACIARGKGDVLERAKTPPQMDLVVATPKVEVPQNKTAWIFRNFDVAGAKEHPSLERMLDAVESGKKERVAMAIGNVFEGNLAMPEYEPVWKLLGELKKKPLVMNACMCGAGPSVYAITRNKRDAEETAGQLREMGTETVFCTKTKK